MFSASAQPSRSAGNTSAAVSALARIACSAR